MSIKSVNIHLSCYKAANEGETAVCVLCSCVTYDFAQVQGQLDLLDPLDILVQVALWVLKGLRERKAVMVFKELEEKTEFKAAKGL